LQQTMNANGNSFVRYWSDAKTIRKGAFNELGCDQRCCRNAWHDSLLVTLLYVAVQMRVANKQREIEALRYNWD
jgi:hypothetical protein